MDHDTQKRFRAHYTGWTQNGFMYEVFDSHLRYEVKTNLTLSEANELADELNSKQEITEGE